MNPVELLMRRRNVLAFIEADSIEVVFTRETKTKTPAGGFVTSWAPLSVCQIARIIPSKRRYAYTGVNTKLVKFLSGPISSRASITWT